MQLSSGVSWLCMALIAWELLGRCSACALGHACIVHPSLNMAIFKRLGIQQPELSEGRPEGVGRKLRRLRHESFGRSKNLTKKTVNETELEQCIVP